MSRIQAPGVVIMPYFLYTVLALIAFQLPFLIAYTVGVGLALVFWRRYPRVCLFTFLACSIKIMASVAYTLLIWADLWPNLLMMLFVALVDASAYGLLLAAIFSGRPGWRPREWPVDPEPDQGSPNGPDSTAIQERK